MDLLSSLPLYDWTQAMAEGMVARWAIGLIYFQGVVITGLFLFVLAICLSRNSRRVYTTWRASVYNERLIGFLLDHLENPAFAPHARYWPWDRSLYRDLLIAQIDSVSGAERELFVNIYRRSGFVKRDERATRSWIWTFRMRAILRLDRIGTHARRKLFEKLCGDSNTHVRHAALRSLCRYPEALTLQMLLRELPRLGKGRRDACTDILLRVMESSGPGIVLKLLEESRDPAILEACVESVRGNRVMEALPSLVCALGTSFSQAGASPLSARIIRSIGALGDPEACSELRPLLRHPEAVIRAATIGALLSIGDPESESWLERAKADPSVEVLRILENWEGTSQREAA